MRAGKAILLFFPLLGLGVLMIYVGLGIGRAAMILGTFFLGDFLDLFHPDTKDKLQIFVIVLMVTFGVIIASISGVGAKDKPTAGLMISRGFVSCIIVGMTLGVGWMFPLPGGFESLAELPENPSVIALVETLFHLAEYELSILAIGVGIMLYYFFAACRRHD